MGQKIGDESLEGLIADLNLTRTGVGAFEECVELPPQSREIEPEERIRHGDKIVTLARRLTQSVGAGFLGASPVEIVSQQVLCDILLTLDRIDGEQVVFHENDRQLNTRAFILEEELERVTRNRAYRGFDYSPEIKRRLDGVEGEQRRALAAHESSRQYLLAKLWIELKELLKMISGEENRVRRHERHSLAR